MDGVKITEPLSFPPRALRLALSRSLPLKRSVQLISHRFLARPTTLGPSKEGLTAGRAVVSFAFSTSPFDAARFVPLFGDFLPPSWNCPFHDFHARGKKEFFDEIARPFPALVARVVPFGFHATADFADLAKAVDFFRRIGLHAA